MAFERWPPLATAIASLAATLAAHSAAGSAAAGCVAAIGNGGAVGCWAQIAWAKTSRSADLFVVQEVQDGGADRNHLRVNVPAPEKPVPTANVPAGQSSWPSMTSNGARVTKPVSTSANAPIWDLDRATGSSR